jgi:hypothetical protein
MLGRAVRSAESQTVPCTVLAIEDTDRSGAAVTRQRGLEQVTTPWVAFLDSDDELDPDHVEHLLACAEETGADYVYPWFRVAGGTDPFPMFFGRQWDDSAPHQTTITFLVRTGLALTVGFSPPPATSVAPDGNLGGEDWHFTLGCVAAGAQIVHLPRRSWTWHHTGKNTSGIPGRGDAS